MAVGVATNYAPKPQPKSISYVKDKLMRPALTSSYDCWFFPPGSTSTSASAADVLKWATNKGAELTSEKREILSLSCSEASLPGSSFATHEITGDYTGVTQKHAYRRIYDDRADFTFYVDSDHYQIHFFESWMSFIANEQFAQGLNSSDFNYRVNYPNSYKGSIVINKYEKDYGRRNSISSLVPATVKYTQYNLLEAFPLSINSMPVSYDTSDVLKCTVSFTFSRYTIAKQEHNIEKIAGAYNKPDGSWDIEIFDGNTIITVPMSNAQYQYFLSQGASSI